MTATDPARGTTPGQAPAPDNGGGDPLLFVRYLDFGLLLLTLPLFLLAGWPLLGWLVGAGLYAGQRIVGDVVRDRAARASREGDARAVVGLAAGSMIGRGWLVALTILAVGLGVDEDAGLAAAVLFLAVFTVHTLLSLILRPFEKGLST